MLGNRSRTQFRMEPRAGPAVREIRRPTSVGGKVVLSFEKDRARPCGHRLPAASERELTDRTLYMEFEPGHFRKQIDIASADGTATKAHVGRRQVERLDQAADILQDQRICD